MEQFGRNIMEFLTKKRGQSKYWLAFSLISALFVLFSLYSIGAIPLVYVDGEPIYAPEVISLVRKYGISGAVNKSVEIKLIQIEATRRDIKITAEDKLREFRLLKRQAELQGKTVADLLVESEQSYQEFSQNVETTITVYKLLGKNLYITEEEVDSYFKDNQLLFEDVDNELLRENVKEILFREKISERYADFIKDAKANSDIDYFLLTE